MISIHPKPKQTKGQTPLRQVAQMKGIQSIRKSDPFGVGASTKESHHIPKERDREDKQNMNPNVKERVKSQQNRQSPAKKILFVRNLNRHAPSPPPDQLQPKYSSLESKDASNSCNSNSALHSLAFLSHHQSQQLTRADLCGYNSVPSNSSTSNIEYYQMKEDKVRVTLKEGKRRKSEVEEDLRAQQASGLNPNQRNSLQKAQSNSNGNGSINGNLNTIPSTSTSVIGSLLLSCPNHPSKEVKYFLLHGDSTPSHLPSYCCSKCAVALVTQGYKVKQIIQEGEGGERGKRLRGFLGEIQRMQPNLKDIAFQLEQVRQIVILKYQEQQSFLNEYYLALQTRIAAMHHESMTTLKLYQESSIDEVNSLESSLQMHHRELLFLKEDITPNLSSIINTHTLSQEAFKVIMGEHEAKIQKIAKEIDRIRKSSVIVGEIKKEIGNDGESKIIVGEYCVEVEGKKRNDKSKNNSKIDPFRMSFGKQTHSPSFSNNDVQ